MPSLFDATLEPASGREKEIHFSGGFSNATTLRLLYINDNIYFNFNHKPTHSNTLFSAALLAFNFHWFFFRQMETTFISLWTKRGEKDVLSKCHKESSVFGIKVLSYMTQSWCTRALRFRAINIMYVYLLQCAKFCFIFVFSLSLSFRLSALGWERSFERFQTAKHTELTKSKRADICAPTNDGFENLMGDFIALQFSVCAATFISSFPVTPCALLSLCRSLSLSFTVYLLFIAMQSCSLLPGP